MRAIYTPGAFVNAALDKASEDNERSSLVIENDVGPAVCRGPDRGVIARRILSFVHEGETLGVGQRFGLIRFGSRVDLYLRAGHGPLVSIGQRAICGETIMADMKSSEPEREARQQ